MTLLAPPAALGVQVAGERAEVRCADPWVRGELAKDFAAHTAAAGAGARLELVLGRVPGVSPAGWRWRECRFSDAGSERRLDYGGGTAAVYDLERERGTVWSPDRHVLRELGYLFLQSRIGLALDRRGLHRVHALGLERGGRAGLVLLPSGGGKTTLALELLRRPGWRLLGDDHPLLDARRGEVRAFQGRPGLRGAAPSWVDARDLADFRRRHHPPKRLLDLKALDGRLAERGRLAWVAFGSAPGSGPARLRPSGAFGTAAALAPALVSGVGLPQVLELLWPGLRPGAWAGLAAVAARRASAAASVRVQGWRLTMGSCPRAAADLVEEADRRSRA
ncbi:hypothetical protein EPO15_12610 [bacterium]|nr:MAG: hypothetical protein EPO15_12610 [bacterium]